MVRFVATSVVLALAACGARTGLGDLERERAADASVGDAAVGVDSDLVTDAAIDVPVVDDTKTRCSPPSTDGKRPPAKQAGKATSKFSRWFAISSFDLRATDVAGFDLDGRTTTACQSKLGQYTCRRSATAPEDALIDGPRGVDDNFGRFVLAAIADARPDAQALSDDALRVGRPTLLVRVDLGSSTSDEHVTGAIYLTDAASRAPTFTVADERNIDSSALVDGLSIDRPLLEFPSGYVADSVWVSGPPSSFTIPLPILGALATLPLEGGMITLQLVDPFHGTIAGGVRTSGIVPALTPALRHLGVCPGSAAYEGVVTAASKASDLVSGAPSLQDEARACDAVSVGLDYIAGPTGAPEFVYPGELARDACGP